MPGPDFVDVWKEYLLLSGKEVPITLFRVNNGENWMLLSEVSRLPSEPCEADRGGHSSLFEELNPNNNVVGYAEPEVAKEIVAYGSLPRQQDLRACEVLTVRDVCKAARHLGYPNHYCVELEALVNVLPEQRAVHIANRLPRHHLNALPTRLPECLLEDHFLLQGYGVGLDELGLRLRCELEKYSAYCTASINLQRLSPAFHRAVQSTTIVSETERIRGFLGFLSRHHYIDIDSLGLACYWNATYLTRFVSFLLARETSKGTVLKHLTIAKKVSDFLISAPNTSDREKEYSARYISWLDALSAQLAQTMPDTNPYSELPRYATVRRWVDCVRRTALTRASQVMKDGKAMSTSLAILVQRAIICSLVIGRDFPPIRLHLIKSMFRPMLDPTGRMKPRRCVDTDCRRNKNCLGNRLEFFDYDENGAPQGLRLHVVHHKNDRKGPASREPFSFEIPAKSDLMALLLVHFLHTRDHLFDAQASRKTAQPMGSAKVRLAEGCNP